MSDTNKYDYYRAIRCIMGGTIATLNEQATEADRLVAYIEQQQAALDAANARIKELEGGLANAESALAIQGCHGNWNYDAYMHGMYNGMEYVLATVTGREPNFKDAPDEWLHEDAAREAGESESPYGYCPKCGSPGRIRERRPNGNDRCENGHTYPSREAVRDDTRG